MAASIRIEDEAFSDRRYQILADECGLADADHARGKMAVLWRQCTLEQRHVLPERDIIDVLGQRGVDGICLARLGSRVKNGVRIHGTKGRIEWLAKLRRNGRYGKMGGRPKGTRVIESKPTRVTKSAQVETPSASASASASAKEKEDLSRNGEHIKQHELAYLPIPEGFEEFWTGHPNKTKKQRAIEAWKILQPDAALHAHIIAGQKRWLASRQWADGKVELAATWLNEKMFDENPEPAKMSEPVEDADRILERTRRIAGE